MLTGKEINNRKGINTDRIEKRNRQLFVKAAGNLKIFTCMRFYFSHLCSSILFYFKGHIDGLHTVGQFTDRTSLNSGLSKN